MKMSYLIQVSSSLAAIVFLPPQIDFQKEVEIGNYLRSGLSLDR